VLRHLVAWSQLDYRDQIGRIGELAKLFPIIKGAADQTGVGEPILEDLKRTVPSIEGVMFTQQTKVNMASGLRALMEQKKIQLPNNRKLILQLNSLRYQISKTGNLLFESPEKEGVHDDYLWALALACYAARRLTAPGAAIFEPPSTYRDYRRETDRDRFLRGRG